MANPKNARRGAQDAPRALCALKMNVVKAKAPSPSGPGSATGETTLVSSAMVLHSSPTRSTFHQPDSRVPRPRGRLRGSRPPDTVSLPSDSPAHTTRFLVISRSPSRGRSNARMKTSIVFAPVRNQVGILFRILGVFALRDIDLVKIESRPDPRSPFRYLFYVDLAGDPSRPNVARALEHLQEMTKRFRLLGVYPRSV